MYVSIEDTFKMDEVNREQRTFIMYVLHYYRKHLGRSTWPLVRLIHSKPVVRGR